PAIQFKAGPRIQFRGKDGAAVPFRDDDREGLDPDEFPDPDEDREDRLISCPQCRAFIYEDSEKCPACGEYLSLEDAPSRKPWWFVVGALICLAISLYWIWPG